MQFLLWCYFTSTYGIHFILRLPFKLSDHSQVLITRAIIYTRKQKPVGLWYRKLCFHAFY